MGDRPADRGQAIQIGAVLIFGLLVVVFASYQAFVVPNQNAGVEFNHHQDAERDMIDVRAAILEAKTTGEERFTTVKLGTEFTTRIIARNPPNPSGTVRTTENRTLQVQGTVDGNDTSLGDWFDRFVNENRFVTYSPTYSEYREGGPIRYENTVVYKDFDDANVLSSDQRLLRNDTISLVPVQKEFQASGRQSASIEPVPSAIQTQEGVEDPTVTLGTELTEEDWEELFAEEISEGILSADDINVTTSGGERVLELDLDGTFAVEYSPVGLGRQPVGFEPGEAPGGDDDDINPASPGDVRLVDSERQQNADRWEATFNNTAATTNWTEARVNFYSVSMGSKASTLENITFPAGEEPDDYDGLNWGIGDDFESFDPPLIVPGENELTMRFEFNDVNPNDGFFVFTVIFESGEQGTYFIGDFS